MIVHKLEISVKNLKIKMQNNLLTGALLFLLNLQVNVESKGQYVQPVMSGLQVALPYDIANIWNRPVSLSPFISTFFGLFLLYIIFFGVITSPFGYMFGVPSQKYVLGMDGSDSLFNTVLQVAEQWHNYNSENENSSDNYNYNTPRSRSASVIRKIIEYKWETPGFAETVFRFIPDKVITDDVACQQLILCHAHSSLKTLSTISVPVFRVFSKTLTNIEEHQREAIKVGLSNANCDDVYHDCPSNILSLLPRILLESLPQWLRKSLVLPQF